MRTELERAAGLHSVCLARPCLTYRRRNDGSLDCLFAHEPNVTDDRRCAFVKIVLRQIIGVTRLHIAK